MTFFARTILGQNTEGNLASGDLCGCNSIMKDDSIINYAGKDEIALYPNGKMKYKLSKKRKERP